jgi:hypothetical protein
LRICAAVVKAPRRCHTRSECRVLVRRDYQCAALTEASRVNISLEVAPMLMYQVSRSGVVRGLRRLEQALARPSRALAASRISYLSYSVFNRENCVRSSAGRSLAGERGADRLRLRVLFDRNAFISVLLEDGGRGRYQAGTRIALERVDCPADRRSVPDLKPPISKDGPRSNPWARGLGGNAAPLERGPSVVPSARRCTLRLLHRTGAGFGAVAVQVGREAVVEQREDTRRTADDVGTALRRIVPDQ